MTPKDEILRRARAGRPTPRLEVMEDRLLPSTLLVNTAADSDERDGSLTLREAVEVSNGTLASSALSPQEQAQVSGDPAASAINTIAFRIPGPGTHTIRPARALPATQRAVIIDGSTQPGFAGTPLIELDRSAAGAGVDGLTTNADKSVVKDLVINRFDGHGVVLFSIDNVVRGNFVGTDVTNSRPLGNLGDGVHSANFRLSGSVPSRSAPLPAGADEGRNMIVETLVKGNGGTGVTVISANGPPPHGTVFTSPPSHGDLDPGQPDRHRRDLHPGTRQRRRGRARRVRQLGRQDHPDDPRRDGPRGAEPGLGQRQERCALLAH